MAKFKLGDKVTHDQWGKGKVIEDIGGTECQLTVQFKHESPDLHDGVDEKHRGGKPKRCWWFTNRKRNDLTPRASKWHRASEPPDSVRDVQVKLSDGTKAIAWHGCLDTWRIYPEGDGNAYHSYTVTNVISWRELPKRLRQPKPAKPERIQVGSKVIIRGVLDRDSHVAHPYHVEFKVLGQTVGLWFDADEVEPDNG